MIYAIRNGDSAAIKFGVARNPKARLSELQTGNPEPLKLEVAVDLPNRCEKQIHSWLRNEGLRGEWFCGEKTEEVLGDLAARARCTHPLEPNDVEYGFWSWALEYMRKRRGRG